MASQVSLPLIIFAIFTTFAATFVTSSFSIFLVKERTSKMKHLQLMNRAGISTYSYWIANYIWDFVTYIIFTLCVVALLLVFGVSEYTGDYGFALFLLLLHYSFAAIPISYLTSKVRVRKKYVENVSKHVICSICYMYVSPLLLYSYRACMLCIEKVRLAAREDIKNLVPSSIYGINLILLIGYLAYWLSIDNQYAKYFLNLVPLPGLGLGMRHILLFRSRDWLSANQGPVFPDSIGSINITFFGEEANVLYFQVRWNRVASSLHDGIGLQVLYTVIILEGLLVTLLLLLLDENFLLFQLEFLREPIRKKIVEGEPLVTERKNVSKGDKDFQLIVDSICKDYGDITVVKEITFGMKHLQLVGLLGPYGYGKSNLIWVLVGEIIPTLCVVALLLVFGVSEYTGYKQCIGYCPQEAATFPNLTSRGTLNSGLQCDYGFALFLLLLLKKLTMNIFNHYSFAAKEVLLLTAGVRLITRYVEDVWVPLLLERAGKAHILLTRYRDRLSGNYQGGVLRELSVPIALIEQTYNVPLYGIKHIL
eukprot:sb/3479734/